MADKGTALMLLGGKGSGSPGPLPPTGDEAMLPEEPGLDDESEREMLGQIVMEFRDASDPAEAADLFLEMMETARRIRRG